MAIKNHKARMEESYYRKILSDHRQGGNIVSSHI